MIQNSNQKKERWIFFRRHREREQKEVEERKGKKGVSEALKTRDIEIWNEIFNKRRSKVYWFSPHAIKISNVFFLRIFNHKVRRNGDNSSSLLSILHWWSDIKSDRGFVTFDWNKDCSIAGQTFPFPPILFTISVDESFSGSRR